MLELIIAKTDARDCVRVGSPSVVPGQRFCQSDVRFGATRSATTAIRGGGGAARPIPDGAEGSRLVIKAYHKGLSKADSPAFARRAPEGVDLDTLDRRLHGAGCRHRDSWHPVGMAVRR